MIWILSSGSVLSLTLLLWKFREVSPWRQHAKVAISFLDYAREMEDGKTINEESLVEY